MPHVLVTGGAGFIGSHLCERLLLDGHLVTCLDNLDPYYSPSVKRANIAAALRHPGFRFVQGDILDGDLLDAVLSGRAGEGRIEVQGGITGGLQGPADAVVHLAALAGVRLSTDHPLDYIRVNVEGTTGLLERARRADVRHFVFASSSAVYGPGSDGPVSESEPLRPASVYGASKVGGEVVGNAFWHLHGLPVTALRFFTVYGPRQKPDMVIHKFARLMTMGRPIPVYGDGTSARDYTYVGDTADGIVKALAHPGGFQAFNLGNSHPVRLASLVEKLSAALGIEPVVERHPDQPGDVPVTWADISRAEAQLGYRPATGLEEGLRRFVEWFRRPSAERGEEGR